jgi:serine/threonine-protein kinase
VPFTPPLTEQEVHAALSGRFAGLQRLQTGGQGSVFRAVVAPGFADEGACVALKIYFPDQLRERLDREVNALKGISCPFLATFVATGECTIRGDNCVWLATEFIEGTSLHRLIQTLGPLPADQVARIVADIASAIQAMWQRRIVHRDIKPDNIMVRPSGDAVLIDLGVARHVDRTGLTSFGATLGTAGYLSPEQARARRSLTCKSDVYALGLAAQEALLGRHPTGRRQDLIPTGITKTAVIVPHAPSALASSIDSMLHRDAHRRPLPRAVIEDLRPPLPQ